MKWIVLAVMLGACSKPVAGVCCITEADCYKLGVDEFRPCPEAQACVDYYCVAPTCAKTGCTAEAPVCDTVTDQCTRCEEAADCQRFTGTMQCDPGSGSCVECLSTRHCSGAEPACDPNSHLCVGCLSSSDCTAAAPVCDGQTCRGCRADSECPSGACGDDGACVPETKVAYADSSAPNDASTCTLASPCRTLDRALSQVRATRTHLVVRGTHKPEALGVWNINPTSANGATSLHIHGSNARLLSLTPFEDPLLIVAIPFVMRDVEIAGVDGIVLATAAPGLLERVTLNATGFANNTRSALYVSAPLEARDLRIEAASGWTGIDVRSSLVLDRARIVGGLRSIEGRSGANVKISNLLAYGATETALRMTGTSGTIEFSTITLTGASAATTAGVECSATVPTIRSSIVWTRSSARAPVTNCATESSIVGPVAGMPNLDPLFVSESLGAPDFHLRAGSPARDKVEAGPATDFEGDARPRGPKFDLGADEAAP